MAVVETLELDISEALDAIASFGEQLSAVAESFGEELNSALNSALTDLPIITPEVDPDPAGQSLSQKLDDAADEERTADVDVKADAEAITEEGQAALDAIDTTVELDVEVDTGQAEPAIEGLGDSLQNLTAQFGNGSTAGDVLSNVLGSGGVTGALTGAARAAGPAAAAIAGVATAAMAAVPVLRSLERTAYENVITTENWERTLGELGDSILDLESGTTGFQTDLRQLAQDMGTSDEALMQQLQTLAVFRSAAGDTADEVVSFSQDITALAAQIVATNPEVGNMDDVVAGLSRGLVTGGRMVQQYGLNFDATAIKAEALRLGLEDSNGEVDRAGLQAAGLSLALRQLPPDYDSVVASQDRLSIRTRSLSQRMGDLREDMGRPLVRPMADIREAMGELTEVAGRALIPVLEGLGFAIGGVSEVLDSWVGRIRFAQDFNAKFYKTVGTTTARLPGMSVALRTVSGWLRRTSDDTDDATSAVERWGEANVRQAATAQDGWTEFIQQRLEDLRREKEQADEWAAGWDARMAGFVETVQQGIPSVSAEFSRLADDGMGVDDILANLDTIFAGTVEWTDNMVTQQELGNDNIVALMAQLGPEKAAVVATMNAEELRKLEEHLGRYTLIEMRARKNARIMMVREFAKARELTEIETQNLVAAYKTNLILDDPTAEGLDAAIDEIRQSELDAEAAHKARAAARAAREERREFVDAGRELGEGASEGMRQSESGLLTTARNLAGSVADAFRIRLGIFSPSRVFIGFGEDIVDGLTAGLEDQTVQAVNAARALADAVTVPAGGVTVAAPAAVTSEQVVNVTVPVTVSGGMDVDDGRRIGEAAGRAASQVVAAQLRMEARVA